MKKLFYFVALLLLSTSASSGLTLNQRLLKAVTEDKLAEVTRLLDAGAIASEQVDGRWPILEARSVDVAEKLLKDGARLDVVNKYGRTALHQAVSRDKISLVKYYLGPRIEPNCRDRYEMTPYDLQ